MVIATILAAGSLAGLFFFGSPEAWRDEVVGRAIGVIFQTAVFVGTFSCMFLGAPKRMEQEAAAVADMQLRALQAELTKFVNDADIDRAHAKDISEQEISSLKEQVAELLEQKKPKLRIDNSVIRDRSEMQSEMGPSIERFYIVVVNEGTTEIQNGLVKVVSTFDMGNGQREFLSALKTAARASDGHSGRFALSGGERKRVLLVSKEYNSGDHGPRVFLETETRSELPQDREYYIAVSAHSEIGLPATAHFTISLQNEYFEVHPGNWTDRPAKHSQPSRAVNFPAKST